VSGNLDKGNRSAGALKVYWARHAKGIYTPEDRRQDFQRPWSAQLIYGFEFSKWLYCVSSVVLVILIVTRGSSPFETTGLHASHEWPEEQSCHTVYSSRWSGSFIPLWPTDASRTRPRVSRPGWTLILNHRRSTTCLPNTNIHFPRQISFWGCSIGSVRLICRL